MSFEDTISNCVEDILRFSVGSHPASADLATILRFYFAPLEAQLAQRNADAELGAGIRKIVALGEWPSCKGNPDGTFVCGLISDKHPRYRDTLDAAVAAASREAKP